MAFESRRLTLERQTWKKLDADTLMLNSLFQTLKIQRSSIEESLTWSPHWVSSIT